MSWNFSTGLQDAILARQTKNGAYVLGSTASIPITFTTAGITAASGLDAFDVDAWVLAISPLNNNVMAKVLTSAAAALTFEAASWTAEAAAAKACLMTVVGGSFKEVMQNSRLDLYSGSRPINADTIESGTLLCTITADGLTFVSGTTTNGLNLGQLASSVLKRGLDPATAATEVWKGDGLAAGTALWGRWYANTVVTGASTTAVRLDGVVTTTSGGDIVMSSGRDVAVDVPAVVTDVNITTGGV